MNPEAQEVLNNILTIDPKDLRRDQRDFLRARSSYLKKSQAEEYKEILEMDESPVAKQETPAPEVPDFVKDLNPEPETMPYNELLRTAKQLGFTGGRAKRGQLEAYIKENNV